MLLVLHNGKTLHPGFLINCQPKMTILHNYYRRFAPDGLGYSAFTSKQPQSSFGLNSKQYGKAEPSLKR